MLRRRNYILPISRRPRFFWTRCLSLEPSLTQNFMHSSPAIQRLREDFPGFEILELKVDITKCNEVKEAMQMVKEQLGSIDILDCFAGVVSCLPSVNLNLEEWNRVLNTNTTGSWLCAKKAAR
jgi:NADP-dependent 3-hydroxy acid dehydrogenase YdfG